MALLPEIDWPNPAWAPPVERLVWIKDPLSGMWFSSARPKASLLPEGKTIFGEEWKPWAYFLPGY